MFVCVLYGSLASSPMQHFLTQGQNKVEENMNIVNSAQSDHFSNDAPCICLSLSVGFEVSSVSLGARLWISRSSR